MSNTKESRMNRIKLKKIPLLIFSVIFLLTLGVYLRYFKHGAPGEILEANRKNRNTNSIKDSEVEESELQWRSFLKSHSFVQIGGVYDACGMYFVVINVTLVLILPLNLFIRYHVIQKYM